jgi:hypothetical protein
MTAAPQSHDELPVLVDGMYGAACTLDDAQLRERIRDWRALRDRAVIHTTPTGARLVLGPGEEMAAVAHLAAQESACCPFYTFTIRIVGGTRELEVSAGPGGEVAVHALLGLLEDEPAGQAASR